MQISPMPDEVDLRTKSRDQLVRMVLDLAVERIQLQQRVAPPAADAGRLAEIEAKVSELVAEGQKMAADGAGLARRVEEAEAERDRALTELAKARADLEEITAPKTTDEPTKGKKSK